MEPVNEMTWRARWREQMRDMAARSDNGYWNRRATDYDDFINTSRFDYGEELVKILENQGVAGPETAVLEIASGVGAVTLPLARKVKSVTAVEPAESMADLLAKNAEFANLGNIDTIVTDFDTFAEQTPDNAFDVVFLCHAAWQFPDISKLITEMSRLSRSYCCLADTMGSGDAENREMQQRLGVDTPTLDRPFYLYNVLHEMDMTADFTSFKHIMRRSEESAESMWKNLVSKYREPCDDDDKVIKEHVASRSVDGVYEAPGTMALMWWRVR